MNSIQKNNLVLGLTIYTLGLLRQSPEDYIDGFEQKYLKDVALSTDTFDDKDKLIRDLKIIANDYYKRVKNKHK
ncbi:hypothetical protein GCM10023310_69070 [Paenibacillus vulneris]|uniref:Uncharacterized protein n=1 Tax=Paenibacillus vulneris TaxID=1133364 RepID=A0ABW3UFC0_9BACL